MDNDFDQNNQTVQTENEITEAAGTVPRRRMRFVFAPFGRYFLPVCLLSLIMIIWQTVMLFVKYSPEEHLFASGFVLPTVFGVVLFLAIFGIATLPLTIPAGTVLPSTLAPTGKMVTFTSTMTGFMILAQIILQFIWGVDLTSQFGGRTVVVVLEIAFSIPSAAYFLMIAFGGRQNTKTLAIFGFFPVLWMALLLMTYYFDSSTSINDALRILSQVSIMSLMASQLFELDFVAGKPKPVGYFVFSFIAILLSSVSAVPKLIFSIFNGFSGITYLTYSLAELCLSAYTVTRILEFSGMKSVVPYVKEEKEKKKKKNSGADNETAPEA